MNKKFPNEEYVEWVLRLANRQKENEIIGKYLELMRENKMISLKKLHESLLEDENISSPEHTQVRSTLVKFGLPYVRLTNEGKAGRVIFYGRVIDGKIVTNITRINREAVVSLLRDQADEIDINHMIGSEKEIPEQDKRILQYVWRTMSGERISVCGFVFSHSEKILAQRMKLLAYDENN